MADKKKKSETKKETDELVNEHAESQSNNESKQKNDQEEKSVTILQEEIAQLAQEKAELQDLYLRKQADFDNYRKRMLKEKSDSIQYANADLIEKMLDVLDNFERAKKAAEDNNDIKAVIDGINMIENTLITLLNGKGLTKLKSLNEPFNPDHHLAIAMEENESVSEAKVTEEFQSGYLLHDRLLRTAKVKVTMPKNN